ncbi:hypothetical protein ACFVVM_32695 [Nocardia sp. NPDC058176]|uniref:hypothetical protein n=1 Tax=Nocardia sp. NPDC058176 TaxID=3346368 RepID=UPI0036DCE163
MLTIHDPILGDVEITPDRFMVIVTNVDTHESRELTITASMMPDPSEAGAERWIDELLGEPWVVRMAVPMIGGHLAVA